MDDIYTTIHSTIININNNSKYKQCSTIHKKYMRARWICLMFEYFDLQYKNHLYYNTVSGENNNTQCYSKKYNINNTILELEIHIIKEIFHINLNILINTNDNNLLNELNILFDNFEKKIKQHIIYSCNELEISNEI